MIFWKPSLGLGGVPGESTTFSRDDVIGRNGGEVLCTYFISKCILQRWGEGGVGMKGTRLKKGSTDRSGVGVGGIWTYLGSKLLDNPICLLRSQLVIFRTASSGRGPTSRTFP